MSRFLQGAARTIVERALQAVDVRAAVRREVVRAEGILTLAGKAVTLSDMDGVVVIALGKAAVPMFLAAEEALAGIGYRAVVVAPAETLPVRLAADPVGAVQHVAFLPGAHPTPTTLSLHAARSILEVLQTATPSTVVLFLISGGASAMVEQPLHPGISLHDLATFSRALVGSGLDITAMNTLRKHLSAVKGGRLARAAGAAYLQCTLLVSDVPSASPDAIGSGPSLPDSTTVAETRALFDLLHQGSPSLPQSVVDWFSSAELLETPKRDDAAFARAHWKVVLSSDHLVQAAVQAAEAAGFCTIVDNSCDEWEYREASRYLLDRSFALAKQAQDPTCLISVGEVGVTISTDAGEGGRNQQFALWCAEALAERGQVATVLSAGSDGIDGHSQAAGAVCDEETTMRAALAGFSVRTALRGFHTTPLLQALGEALYTGPTGNNLRDLRLVLTAPGILHQP